MQIVTRKNYFDWITNLDKPIPPNDNFLRDCVNGLPQGRESPTTKLMAVEWMLPIALLAAIFFLAWVANGSIARQDAAMREFVNCTSPDCFPRED